MAAALAVDIRQVHAILHVLAFDGQVEGAPQLQVDEVGINSMYKTIILGECKWSPRPAGRSVLKELLEKTGEILPSRGKWRVYYLGFARAGWTPEAHKFAREIGGAKPYPWCAAGMRLVDLNQVDQDLQKWSA
jgi:hypothetical protein